MGRDFDSLAYGLKTEPTSKVRGVLFESSSIKKLFAMMFFKFSGCQNQ